jgi:hypothetical protein
LSSSFNVYGLSNLIINFQDFLKIYLNSNTVFTAICADLLFWFGFNLLLGFFLWCVLQTKYVKSLSKLKANNSHSYNLDYYKNLLSFVLIFVFYAFICLNLNTDFQTYKFVVHIVYWFYFFNIAFFCLNSAFSPQKKRGFKVILKKIFITYTTKKVLCFYRKNRFKSIGIIDSIFLGLFGGICIFQSILGRLAYLFYLRFLILGWMHVIIYYNLCLTLITFCILTPWVQKRLKTKYGHNVFRFLGWNSPGRVVVKEIATQSKAALVFGTTVTGALIYDEVTAESRNLKTYECRLNSTQRVSDLQATAIARDPSLKPRPVILPLWEDVQKERLRHTAVKVLSDLVPTKSTIDTMDLLKKNFPPKKS